MPHVSVGQRFGCTFRVIFRVGTEVQWHHGISLFSSSASILSHTPSQEDTLSLNVPAPFLLWFIFNYFSSRMFIHIGYDATHSGFHFTVLHTQTHFGSLPLLWRRRRQGPVACFSVSPLLTFYLQFSSRISHMVERALLCCEFVLSTSSSSTDWGSTIIYMRSWRNVLNHMT